jgi:hypothetical protein
MLVTRRVPVPNERSGKWHVGFFDAAELPTRRGFETALGSHSGSVVHSVHCRHDRDKCWMHPRLQTPPTNQTLFDLFNLTADTVSDSGGVPEVGVGFWHGQPPIHATELYSRRFEEIVANHDERDPLFVFLSWSGPHHPFQPQSREELGARTHLAPTQGGRPVPAAHARQERLQQFARVVHALPLS